jgi:hypothetical protein
MNDELPQSVKDAWEVHEQDNQLCDSLLLLADAKKAKEEAEANYKKIAKEYQALLEEIGEASHSFVYIDSDKSRTKYKLLGTKVAPTSLTIDEEGLKKELGEEKWKTVSRRVLDRKLLEHAILNDTVNPQALADHSEEVPKTPYVRVTIKELKDDSE